MGVVRETREDGCASMVVDAADSALDESLD
jgi:hypothetical protein